MDILGIKGFIVVVLTVSIRAIPYSRTFDPRENVWVTLARSLNTTSFCASLATPSSPFTTCLVGVPLTDVTFKVFNESLSELRQQYKVTSKGQFMWNDIAEMFEKYDNWDDKLPVGPEPQEIDLADSLNASHSIYIGAESWTGEQKEGHIVNETAPTILFPIGNHTGWRGTWCQKIDRDESSPAPGTVLPRRLPKGFFLICGNRAWSGIPSNPQGGPCTIGQLSLAAPLMHPNSTHRYRFTRDTSTA